MRYTRFLWALLFAALVSPPQLSAQIEEFEDDFETEDPIESGDWVVNGATADVAGLTGGWREADLDPCADVGDVEPCNLTPDEAGYILVTANESNLGGNMFRAEPFEWDDFRLEMTVELNGVGGTGCNATTPADGMAVVILGSDDPPGVGTTPPTGGGGGGMGSMFGVGYPHMIFEFDNWSNGGVDNNNNNHVGFAYFPDGHVANDQVNLLPGQSAQAQLDPFADGQLNNLDPLGEPNRWTVETLVQNGTIAYNLENELQGFEKRRMFTLKIRDFVSYEGYLGVTASTGGACQNHMLHDVRVSELAEGFCLAPPAIITRSFDSPLDPEANSGEYVDGTEISVTLTLSEVRVADDNCAAAGDIIITEVLPTDWTAANLPPGSDFDAPSGTLTIPVAAADVIEGAELTYTAVAAADPLVPTVTFVGSFVEDVEFAEPAGVGGDDLLTQAVDFDGCGGITAWNILGAYLTAGGNPPPVDVIEADYLTDGDVTEMDFLWFPGATVETDFGGASAALGLFADANNVNPDGIPTVLAWNQPTGDSFVNLNDMVYGGDPNDCMAYMQTYINNDSGDELEVAFKATSDDAIQVILNGESIWTNSVARGSSGPCVDAVDIITATPDGDPVVLLEGENNVIVKVFEIAGGFNGGLAILDPADQVTPLNEDLSLSKAPFEPPNDLQFRRGDPDNSGGGNITDAIAVLNHLFAGADRPACWAAADANGDGGVNVSDPVYQLNFLFGGGDPTPPPGPDDCGAGTAADEALGCDEYTSC